MKFLPIVERELRVASRRALTYWFRSGVVLAVLGIATFIYLANLDEPQRVIGLYLFRFLAGGSQAYCLFAGLRATADCLSEEKREGTLGLLFLTDLKGYDVVLGKLAANSLSAIYGVLALIPMMAIPIMLGGTSVGEFVRVAAVLVNTLFMSLCVGLASSAICRSARASVALTAIVLLGCTVGLPALGALLAYESNSASGIEIFMLPCPVFNFVMALELPIPKPALGFYASLITIHLIAWASLLFAVWLLPQVWQERTVMKPTPTTNWEATAEADAAESKRRFRRRSLDINPFYWLTTRPQSRAVWVWALLGFALAVWCWGMLRFERDWFNVGVYLVTAIFLNSTLKAWVASESSRVLVQERKSGSIELLLGTPLSVRDIVRGQWLSLMRQFAGPVLVVLFSELMMLAALLGNSDTASEERNSITAVWLAGLSVMMLDFVACYWLGMWMGVSARNPLRAFSNTVAVVMPLPWGLFAMTMIVWTTAINFGWLGQYYRQRGPEWWEVLGIWTIYSVLVDVVAITVAKRRLLLEFRERAAARYQQKVSWWRKFLSA